MVFKELSADVRSNFLAENRITDHRLIVFSVSKEKREKDSFRYLGLTAGFTRVKRAELSFRV